LPFTLSHPAAVLPFRKKMVFSALVVGSMAPDFHYFLDLAPKQYFGHTILGLFVFCLPVGLAVLWTFQTIMKVPLMSLAPYEHQQRLVSLAAPFRWGPSSRFVLILCSLLLGSLTHIAWDSVTHDRGYVVRNIPDLRKMPLQEFGSERPLFNVLQHGSSMAGLAILLFAYRKWFKRTPPQEVPAHLRSSPAKKAKIAAVIIAISGAVASVYGYVISEALADRRLFIGLTVVVSLSVLYLEAIAFGLWWRWKMRAFSNQHSALSPHG
jgi:Domain of unknown function (DUF4184)